MSSRALADFIHVSKYANYVPELKRRETKEESGQRMFDMHRRRYPHLGAEIDWLQEMFNGDFILGSQRAMQFGGRAIERVNARLFNCTVSHCDRPRFFQEAFWLLLCGCGTGFSVQRHHVAKLPDLHTPAEPPLTHIVADSIEGWADALGALVDSYMVPGRQRLSFNYDQVRPEGSPLSSSNGKAPGPAPLARALNRIRALLTRCVPAGKLRPIDAYDLVMHASDAVLAGGVRRSSAICIFSSDDDDMARAKTGNWLQENPQRARSNNSALLLRGQTPRETFDHLLACAREGGDPGFYWSSHTEMLPNPCGEIGMMPVNGAGVTGWQFCNLTTINMEKCQTPARARMAARAAAWLGTLQAGYTSFPYLGAVSEEITREEALLGVSMTGVMRNPRLSLDPLVLRAMAREVLDANEYMAQKIGINVAARATCMKPEGTGSLLLQTSSGITPDHSRRYIRHTQANRNEPPFKFLKSINPEACEGSKWTDGGEVIAFCVEAPAEAVVKDDVSALDLLRHVKLVKESWVDAGRRPERCRHPSLSHNVSNTIHVRDDEWGEVGEYIFANQDAFAGVALLSSTGDLDYAQAPFVAVKTAEEITAAYGGDVEIRARVLAGQGLDLFAGDLWRGCEVVLGTREAEDNAQRQWAGAVSSLFAGDARRATYCLKDVYLLSRWHVLRAVWRPVDYRLMREDDDVTKFEAEAACAGGACTL